MTVSRRRFEYDVASKQTNDWLDDPLRPCRASDVKPSPRSPFLARVDRRSRPRQRLETRGRDRGYPRRPQPDVRPAAANLASRSRSPDDFRRLSAVSLFRQPCLSRRSPPRASPQRRRSRSGQPGRGCDAQARERRGRRRSRRRRAATPAAATLAGGFVESPAVSLARPRRRPPRPRRVPSRRRRRESIGSSAASCVFRVVSTDAGAADLAAAAARTRRDASASPASGSACALAGGEACARGLRRTPAAPRSRRSRGCVPRGSSRARPRPRRRGLRGSARRRAAATSSSLGRWTTNNDDLLGGFARAPRAVAAVAVGKHHRLDGVERVRAHAFFDGSTASCERERRRRRVSNLDGRGIRPRETRHRERMSEGIFYKLDRKYW